MTPLVMTSGNLSGEPQVIGNDEARANSPGIADALLLHDRDIRRRLDDSVERVTPHGPMILRRGRGRVPGTLPLPPGSRTAPRHAGHRRADEGRDLPDQDRPGAAVASSRRSRRGADLLRRIPQGRGRFTRAFRPCARTRSPATCTPDTAPACIRRDAGGGDGDAADPRCSTTTPISPPAWANISGRATAGPVAGIILDGLGLGTDGTIWGGEVLLGDYAGFERIAWLRPVPLPGGDAANREPWRNALARLDASGRAALADRLLPGRPLATLRHAMAEGLNAPLSSSAGRLFDAFACLLGFDGAQSFEGEAAMGLEALAARAPGAEGGPPYGFGDPARGGAMDDTPLWDGAARDLADGTAPEVMAHRFHAALARSFALQARRSKPSTT
jgi:hydrogenase maturation protein HypF